ncbi:neuB protein [Psychromonas sp. CNPT3]|uniref:pseudaminic acid synthase n=1 Tax=Psychromonas sp. CNPT3 TaxID=314282 RepID=UPI00006E48BE|nr:pseudaminic acid synthase [Psychromonas sp. CNPT3]AGH80989.1 neuB protein [Psychromonas sp. CNPT3]
MQTKIKDKLNIPEFISIDGTKIGAQYPPYIIAELSANHNGDIKRAFKILEMAKECGANALKLQTYTPDTITIDCARSDFCIEDGLWAGRTLHDLYKEAHMPWDWHQALFERAAQLGITIFSSPFDFSAVDLLEKLGAPAYKIASFEAIDLALIRYVAKTGKPLIISTGMADQQEIQEAVDAARAAGCNELILLHCVSGYPTPARDQNLKTLVDMSARYDALIGLSDHSIDNVSAITSIALGACIIEKHVTLDRSAGGPDDSFSLQKEELTALCRDTKIAWSALGAVNYQCKDSEKSNKMFRRSLYVVKDIEKGALFTADNVKSIRPGYGIGPKHIDSVLGKTAKLKLLKGTAFSMDFIA